MGIYEDKISKLPDDLLLHILLLLVPTKDAVATTILSKRWRLVWTMMPRLKYKEREDDYASVWWFLDKSLQLHKAPVIDSLCIKLGPHCPVDVDLGKWITKAVDRLVCNLNFKLLWSGDPISLPKSLYNSETLKELKLSQKVLIDFPSSGCLPSLKILCLIYVMYKDDASLVTFLASCPVLKMLRVLREFDDNMTSFCVNVPSLMDLTYEYYGSDSNRIGNIVIDTPALKHLSLFDSEDYYYSIQTMPCLESEYLAANIYPDEKLSRSLSTLFSLELFVTHEMLVFCSTVFFSRLVKLTICPYISDWLEPLILLLGNSPKLKHISVDYDAYYDGDTLSWKEPDSVPKCLSFYLEIFEWKQKNRGRVEARELVKYILANAKCLKTTTILLKSFNLKRKKKVIKELESVPRASKSSELLFK